MLSSIGGHWCYQELHLVEDIPYSRKVAQCSVTGIAHGHAQAFDWGVLVISLLYLWQEIQITL